MKSTKFISKIKSLLMFLFCSYIVTNVYTQDLNQMQTDINKLREELTSQKKEFVAIKSCDNSDVDAFVIKSFETYSTSKELSQNILFRQVVIKTVPDKGDGVTTEWVIINGKGEDVTIEGARDQLLNELLPSIQNQSKNINELKDLHIKGQDAIAKLGMMAKIKPSKSFAKGVEMETYIIQQTAIQLKLINQQIAQINAMKQN